MGLSLLLAGCLPFSCNRVESNSLAPADSLSRALASTVPVDTMAQGASPEIPDLSYPRTLEFGEDGTLWIADSGKHRLIRLSLSGQAEGFPLDSLQYPYMAGFRGGDPVVFSPAIPALAAVRDGEVVWSIQTPPDPTRRALKYAVVADSMIWVKMAGKNYESRLLRLDGEGRILDHFRLEEPFWRWAGALRMTDAGVVSLSGYRPVLYTPSEGGEMDSTQLFGFDSPMLARSFAFLSGQIDEPPLLTPSASWFEGRLYVLNVRPGWLQVDQFGPDMVLERILVEHDPTFGQEFYPTDLSLYRNDSDRLLMAVAVVEPRPEIRLYTVPPGR